MDVDAPAIILNCSLLSFKFSEQSTAVYLTEVVMQPVCEVLYIVLFK